ncbi:MAG TPA: hypothetical protein VJ652_16490 [Noviherbaspirillum sp.]|nr:hypothetical protein [Noviherbaspirillum sp.]
MNEHNGTVQPGAPVVLATALRVTKADIAAALDSLGVWVKPNQVRQALPDDKWAQIGINNIADRLRDMADAGEIARRYDRHGRPEYRRIEE